MGSDDGHIKDRFSWGPVSRTPKLNPAQEYAWIVRRTVQLLAEEIDAGIPVDRLARVLAVPMSVVQE